MNLKELGLSEYEQKTYETLIHIGKSTASRISRHAQVSYGKIYEVLASLENKGLVKTIPESTKKFVASSPDALMNIVDVKEEQLTKIKQEIDQLKQIYVESEKEVVEIVKGKKNFYRLSRDQISPKRSQYSIKYTFAYEPNFVNSAKKQLARKVDVKVLGRFDAETKNNISKWKKIYSSIKQIPNNGIAMSVTDDEEVMIALIKSNTSILIRDKAFTELMKTLFLNYYEKN